ncbi:hypothetical protein J6590_108215 [Homalodisca vitripennis]|nr:hypothetical protein J6590_108215 [Homalodisca vitripennis]
MVVPGCTCFSTRGMRVFASRLFSGQISILYLPPRFCPSGIVSIKPRIQVPSTNLPLLFFRLPILQSSISTTTPGPPSFSSLLNLSSIQTKHTSLQNNSQSDIVLLDGVCKSELHSRIKKS